MKMVLDRVLNYINKKQKQTLVYLYGGVIRCTVINSKLAGIVLNNKYGDYLIVGVYTADVSPAAMADDLAEIGFRE